MVPARGFDADKRPCSFQARAVFDQICPGEDFLPKAPNPEDIILDDGTVASKEGSGFESTDGAGGESEHEVQSDDKTEMEETDKKTSPKENGTECVETEKTEKEPAQERESTKEQAAATGAI